MSAPSRFGLIVATLTTGIVCLLMPMHALAQPSPFFDEGCPSVPCYSGSGVEQPNVEGIPSNLSVTDVLLRIIRFFLDFVLILSMLMLIIAGLYLIVSLGDEGNKEKAKKIVIYVIVGILLILFARAIVVFVNHALFE